MRVEQLDNAQGRLIAIGMAVYLELRHFEC